MQITNLVKLYVVFGIIFLIGLFISIFIAFRQVSINPYIVLAGGFFTAYFGAKGIYKTIQIQLKGKTK